jgi:hypothetical protein
MFDTTYLIGTAFFNKGSPPRTGLAGGARGSFYNCVFRENSNNWLLAHGQYEHPWVREFIQFKIENCTFFTKGNSVVYASDTVRVLLKNCIFNKSVTTEATQVNCATSVTVGSKYVVTGVTDKGVYAGEYGWSSVITTPEKNAPLAGIMARGGGGAPAAGVDNSSSPEFIGGCGPGNSPGTGHVIAFIQPEHQANIDYSSYGYPGGSGGTHAGGGGAGGPAAISSIENTIGGVGIEWPIGSGVYYGSGGSGRTQSNITPLAVGTVGKGADGTTAASGNDGIVMVRYLVPGSYTPPVSDAVKNLIAVGGVTKIVGNYREHVFTASGTFRIIQLPNIPDFYLDMIIVGGGGGGAGGSRYRGYGSFGGAGQVQYVRHFLKSEFFNYFNVVIGAGGSSGDYDYFGGTWGTSGFQSYVTVSLTDPITNTGQFSYFASAGSSGPQVDNVFSYPRPITNAVQITNGLFSDNTAWYGGTGGWLRATGSGGFGPPVLEDQVDNWGGPGSSGYGGGNSYSDGQSGRPGIVIIRYPIYPTS